jgi:hypothetical protein
MSNELTLYKRPSALMPLDEAVKTAKIFFQSGLFKDTADASKAVVKIMAGQELGFGPVQSMNGLSIIQGRVCIGAGLMASALKGHPKYDYRIKEHNDTVCCIVVLQRNTTSSPWEEIGESSFSIKDAEKAGLTSKAVWKQYPRNMLFSRAISNALRWFAPDVFSTPVYTPEEMGEDKVESNIDIIDVTPKPLNNHLSFEDFFDKAKEETGLSAAEIRQKLIANGYEKYDSNRVYEMMALLKEGYKDQNDQT